MATPDRKCKGANTGLACSLQTPVNAIAGRSHSNHRVFHSSVTCSGEICALYTEKPCISTSEECSVSDELCQIAAGER